LRQSCATVSFDQHRRPQTHPVPGGGGRLSPDPHLIPYINVKLALLGFPPVATRAGAEWQDIVTMLVAQHREKERLLANHLCPADGRIQSFIYDYLQDVPVAKLP